MGHPFSRIFPGLVSSILMWMNFYFIVRYRDAEQTIPPVIRVWALVVAALATAFLTLYIPLVKGRQKSKRSRRVRRAASGGRERLLESTV